MGICFCILKKFKSEIKFVNHPEHLLQGTQNTINTITVFSVPIAQTILYNIKDFSFNDGFWVMICKWNANLKLFFDS